MPLLDGLSEIHVPPVTQHVVQTADHIASASPSPKQALLIIVKAVTGDAAYWREPAGADAALGFVRRFAADNRAIFSETMRQSTQCADCWNHSSGSDGPRPSN